MASTVETELTVYRIGAARYITDTRGTGAKLTGGRWNDKGRAVVYTSQSIALACLEVLVHYGQRALSTKFRKLSVTLPQGTSLKEVRTASLSKGWSAFPESRECREIGNAWLDQGRYCILKVPSVVVPEEHNFLLNPQHPEFKRVRFGKPQKMNFDPRLYQK
ncbi:MAG: RES family NAD+ phosphorylase [Candidatus Omnitrophica bacterium]|nr:RES family NAD+ phosphorylase [Candidatus Omnitrophota bacterium]MCB9721687.1 RES family NAD+ phosphorylase [Candidatus Omnitrophota bacterium]